MDPRAQIGQMDKQDIIFMVGRIEEYVTHLDGIQRHTDFSPKINPHALLWWELNRISTLASAIEDDWILWWEADNQILPSVYYTLLRYEETLYTHRLWSKRNIIKDCRETIETIEQSVRKLAEADLAHQTNNQRYYTAVARFELEEFLSRLPRWIETLVDAHHLLQADENRTTNKEATIHE